MKKILFFASVLAGLFLAGSCQQESLEPVADGGVTYTITLPETVQTRGESGYAEYDLYYEVYKTIDATELQTTSTLFEKKVTMTGNTYELTLDLLNDQDYTVLFWANKKDKSYFNVDDLRNVQVKDADETKDGIQVVANCDDRDAFCGIDQISQHDGAQSKTVTLTRPFAQLNIATLVSTTAGYLLTPEESRVKVTVPVAYNVATASTVGNAVEVDFTKFSVPAGQKVNGTYDLVAMNYVLVPQGNIDVYYEIQTVNGTVNNTVNNVPLKKNYRTNILGNLLTSNATYTVELKPGFEPNGYVVEGATSYHSVSSAEELQKVFEEIVAGTAETDNIILSGDIDLSELVQTRSAESNWTPIGTEEHPYKGEFNGNGYTIKNLKLVETEAKEGKAFIGFFGYAKDATIKNVTFENVYMNIPCLDIDHSQGHIGAVAGSLEGTSTIENVTVKGDIKVEATVTANGASRVAVVAGGNSYGNVTMKNVHVIANEGSYLKANNNVGALAGQLQGKNVFENCSSNIDVTGTKFFAGGIIGLAAGDSQFTNCHTTGDVTVTAGREGRHNDEYRVGGIAGGWADGKTNVCTLTNCSYTGNVSGTNADGSVASPLDYMGYVGRGYTLNGCQGSKVVIDGVSFVQVGDSAPFGNYELTVPVATKAELINALETANVTSVVLNPGTYDLDEILYITNPVTLLARDSSNMPVVKGKLVANADFTAKYVKFEANAVTSQNLDKGVYGTYVIDNYNAIVTVNRTSATFEGCEFNGGDEYKVAINYFQEKAGAVMNVTGCSFTNTYIYSKVLCNISDNTFTLNDCPYPICVWPCPAGSDNNECTFVNNRVTSNYSGDKAYCQVFLLSQTAPFANVQFNVQGNTGNFIYSWGWAPAARCATDGTVTFASGSIDFNIASDGTMN